MSLSEARNQRRASPSYSQRSGACSANQTLEAFLRNARLTLLLLSLSLFSAAAHAQTFEQIAFIRLTDSASQSVRSAALGGTTDAASADAGSLGLNPALSASLKRASFLASASRTGEQSAFSHAALAFPLRTFVVGAYYSSEPQIEGPEPIVSTFGTFPYQAPPCPNGCSFLFRNFNSSFARRDQRYGVTAAIERGNLSLGVGAEVQDVHEEAQVLRVAYALVAEPIVNAPHERIFRSTEGREIVANAGLRWKVTPRVALAAAYNGAASFTRRTSACRVNELEWDTCTTAQSQIGSSPQRMPDAYRMSASIRPIDRLAFVAEAVRRNYSNLADDQYTMIGEPRRLEYRDVTELHAGIEYRFAAVALRAGWWRDPARLNFPEVLSSSIEHYTLGAGINLGPAQVEVSVDDANDAVARRAMVGLRFEM
jgi:hypothetical protein